MSASGQEISNTLPTYFISHGGGPWPWLKEEMPGVYDKLEESLRDVPRQIGVRPRAVLVVSGHWEEPDFTVMSRSSLINTRASISAWHEAKN